MKLITANNGVQGYYLKDLRKYLKKAGRLEEFSKWYGSSTAMIYNGKILVYKWDYDNFIAGLPNLD